MTDGEARGVMRLFVDVLAGPGKAFATIVARPRFLTAALVFCGIGLVLAAVLAPKVQAATLLTLEKQAASIPPDKVEMVRRTVPVAAMVGSLVSAAAGP
ncbi:MAG: hypothetical protein AB1776_02450, partial [Bacillota bacterium]